MALTADGVQDKLLLVCLYVLLNLASDVNTEKKVGRCCTQPDTMAIR